VDFLKASQLSKMHVILAILLIFLLAISQPIYFALAQAQSQSETITFTTSQSFRGSSKYELSEASFTLSVIMDIPFNIKAKIETFTVKGDSGHKINVTLWVHDYPDAKLRIGLGIKKFFGYEGVQDLKPLSGLYGSTILLPKKSLEVTAFIMKRSNTLCFWEIELLEVWKCGLILSKYFLTDV